MTKRREARETLRIALVSLQEIGIPDSLTLREVETPCENLRRASNVVGQGTIDEEGHRLTARRRDDGASRRSVQISSDGKRMRDESRETGHRREAKIGERGILLDQLGGHQVIHVEFHLRIRKRQAEKKVRFSRGGEVVPTVVLLARPRSPSYTQPSRGRPSFPSGRGHVSCLCRPSEELKVTPRVASAQVYFYHSHREKDTHGPVHDAIRSPVLHDGQGTLCFS